MSVCLCVAFFNEDGLCDIDRLYMDRSEIYRGMSRNRLEVATTNISDGMDGKLEIGRKKHRFFRSICPN